MALTINHNYQSEFTQLNLSRTQMSMNSSLEKLSSGYRINSAKDDASGLFIADQLKLVADALDQGSRNALTGISVSQIAETSLSQVYDKLKDMYTKAQDAANDVNGASARQALQTDIQKLASAIDTIAKTSEYNGLSLLDGTFTDKSIHYGARADQTTSISISSARSSDLGANVLQGAGATNVGASAYTALLAADPTFQFDTGETLQIAGQDVLTGFTNLDAIDAKKIADNINNDATLQGQGITASASNESTAASTWTNFTVGGTDSLALSFFVGNEPTADFTLTYTNADGAVTINDVVSAINTQASANGLNLVASAEDNYLVLKSDGETIGMQATLTDNGGGTATNVDQFMNVASTVVDDGTLGAVNGSAIQVGQLTVSGADAYTVNYGDVSASGAGLDLNIVSGNTATKTSLNALDVTTNSGAELALRVLDQAIKTVDAQRAQLGSNQIEFQALIDNNDFSATQTREAESRIRNVDFAKEMSDFTMQQTLMQSGMAMLSQANQLPSMVLQLLQ